MFFKHSALPDFLFLFDGRSPDSGFPADEERYFIEIF